MIQKHCTTYLLRSVSISRFQTAVKYPQVACNVCKIHRIKTFSKRAISSFSEKQFALMRNTISYKLTDCTV